MLMLKVVILILFVSPFLDRAHGLSEFFDLYTPPQGLSMGNALTADAQGYLANYYNPAGLAKAVKTKADFIALDAELIFNGTGIGQVVANRSFGMYRMVNSLSTSPGSYSYLRAQMLPSFTVRGFGIGILAAYQYAGISDGTTVDINSRVDIAPTIGFARNFFGNILKLGVTGKYIIRNELNGTYAHSALNSDTAIASQMREGSAFGIDAGTIITLPYNWLPTIGFVAKDIMDTRFTESHILNSSSTGTPDDIAASYNVAFSLHPFVARRLKSIFAIELKHIERSDLPITKKLHFGIQLEDEKTFYVWAGLHQTFMPCFGFAYRVKGGHLEVGTNAVDIGNDMSDRRFYLRYTIAF